MLNQNTTTSIHAFRIHKRIVIDDSKNLVHNMEKTIIIYRRYKV